MRPGMGNLNAFRGQLRQVSLVVQMTSRPSGSVLERYRNTVSGLFARSSYYCWCKKVQGTPQVFFPALVEDTPGTTLGHPLYLRKAIEIRDGGCHGGFTIISYPVLKSRPFHADFFEFYVLSVRGLATMGGNRSLQANNVNAPDWRMCELCTTSTHLFYR